MDKELIVLLDSADQPIGSAPKLASHHANTPLHLAFSCYIFNDRGQPLLTRRALSKKVWPGVWTNSVCGHPAPGEALIAAVQRRANYELGITGLSDIEEKLPDYHYCTPPYNGVIENEFCPVFTARLHGDVVAVRPNPDEVEEWRWVEWSELPVLIQADPAVYSYWLKDQLPSLMKVLASTTH